MTTTQRTRPSYPQFEQLFQRSRSRAYKLAYRLIGNATEAEDITQDAYVCAWQHFARFDASRSFESWLFRIITNRVIDFRRRQKRRQVYSLDAPMQEGDSPPLGDLLPAPHSDPEQIVMGPIPEERLQAALCALPDTYRRALLLCSVEERSYQEIADTMRCSLGTVRSRIHRGKHLVRRTLEHKTDPEGV
jgi:RNA polymerase sigma-70 factor (ECF subfamily)